MRLLLIEDDLQAAEYLVKGLRENGYAVEHSPDGRDGLTRALRGPYDVIIADRQLPAIDGLAIVAALRERNDRTPVLILSALGTVDDRVHGLRAGGDDYLTKPFAFAELLARIEALCRRSSSAAAGVRLSCVSALGALRAERTLPAILARLDDEEAQVRQAAVVALYRIGSPPAREGLRRATHDTDWEVQVYASEALRRLP